MNYNIYYKDKKINKLKLSEKELKHIMENDVIKKYDNVNKCFVEIPTKDIIVHKLIQI